MEAIFDKIHNTRRLSPQEGERLFQADLLTLGSLADEARLRLHPRNWVTFVLDRNISYTNSCVAGCLFCAFQVKPGSDKEFHLTLPEVLEKVGEMVRAGGTQVMLQGGLSPRASLQEFEALFRAVKAHYNVHLHSLSAPEIDHLSRQSGLPVREVLLRLRDAGLDSLPGGGAEILDDEVRSRVSPHKINTGRWLEIMETAHQIGMHSTATMVFGLGESIAQRIHHLDAIRTLQDRTHGFKAFIPWSFSAPRTALELPPAGGQEYLRMVALSRLYLDNFPHIHSGWVTEGQRLAQVALTFGADDLGGVLMEEQVLRSTGVDFRLSLPELLDLIRAAGRVPAQRNTRYEILKVYE